tara:strand:- start:952 stop:1314 length:363 start_codon:yes stop_codon:yes gene_type:complete
MKKTFKDLNFEAFIPLTDEYAVSVVASRYYSKKHNKKLYEIGVMRLINKETGEYELEQDGPNYYDVMPYLEEDEVTIVMEMIQNNEYSYYYSRVHKERYKNNHGITVENKINNYENKNNR